MLLPGGVAEPAAGAQLAVTGGLYLDVFPYVKDGHAPHGIDMGALTGVTKLFLKLHCCFNGARFLTRGVQSCLP